MEKRLRSSLQTSAEEFLSSAAKLPFKSSKSAIKTLINTSVKPASDLTSSLPLALCNSISHSISRYKNLHDSTFAGSPVTPPAKRARRSSRNKKEDGVSSTQHRENGRQSIVGKLQVYAYILRLCVFHPKSAFSVSDLLPAAQELHDNLILFESDSILLSEIASLCEEWWKGDLLGKETLISQSLPVMLSRSLTLKKKIDVHRVYTLREAFMLFDFEDESIEDLKHLLIRCVISPLYLKTEEGRKFIAFMFGFSVQLMKEVCAMIKSQIPFGRKSMLEAYGEIFFRAWKAAEGECKYEIENGFLQGLIEGAIYASSAALAASIRRILGGFVSNRTTEGAEKLIFCLAEPIIFRSLQVANSNVRQNALHLLLDLFPLEDPDATKEAKDTLLEKQFFLLDKLLMDECPDVRAVAVEGSCRILYLFWEVIPSPIITKNITRIFDDMAHDACTEVRLSTVNGVIYLLGNPQSHEVLKVLLPRLGNLIMDSTSAVRAAVADLLLLLNDIRNFHFHKVVSIDILVSTLANDQPLVARKITKLLIPSYFPSKVMEEEACKRMITLIKRSPTAGARFCEFAALEGASLRSLMKLFKVLSDLIMSSVKLDEEIVEGLLVAASHLCTNLAKDASFEPALREELSAEKLKTFFTVASTSRAQSSICNIISTMSPDAVGDLFEDCMGLINRFCGLSDVIERQAEMRSAHKMILSCGWFDDMFGVLVGCLQKAACGCHAKFGVELGKQNVGSAIRRTKSSTKVSSKSKHCNGQRSSNTDINRFSEDYASAVGVSWQIKELLLHENSRKAMLGSRHLESAYSALKVISEASVLYCLQYDYLNTWSVSAYTTLTLHMSLHNIKTDLLEHFVTTYNLVLNLREIGNLEKKVKGNGEFQINFVKASISDLTLDHLLHCANNVFRANHNNTSDNDSLPSESLNSTNTKIAPGYSTDSGECQTGTSLTKQLRISNMVKMLTAVLKFVADATAMNLVTRSQDRCLNFTTENLKFIITNLRERSIAQPQITEEDLKDIFICLKSSLTYSSKLLNIMLKACGDSSCQAGAYSLVNELFNLIVSVEEFLGYGYAARLVTVIQPWVPDMILALGSNCLGKQTPDKGVCSDSSENAAFHLPSWFYILARVELCEQRDTNSDDDTEEDQHAKDFSAFKRLVETMSMLLKSNNKILDAVGVIFLTGSLSALQSKKFDLVLGLLHFVSVKLVSPEDTEWKELKLMLASIEEIYPKVEREAEELGNNESDRQKLYSAKALLEPVWASFIYDDRRHSMEEE
ncbi:UNVERIFIED_CONTAM: Condensin-2 complex subunit G2 [Sesamum radiatum]|uniref:Condensin-2 complex subunit G2 n=1 Tax=Sesamum radiatum TaxID=300843 RepID=A0AAW2P5T6_SESRA